MKKTAVYALVSCFMFLFGFISPSPANQLQKSTCINCHTNDAVLKSLFTPPKVEASEGEG
jgi:hypothetical protein